METNSTAQTDTSEQVILEKDKTLAIIRLGSSAERAVILTEARMRSLYAALDEIEQSREIRGLVIIGAAPGGYCAGADINVIKSLTDSKVGEEMARLGQEIYNRIATLRCTTVAAVDGACVGGGCELVLACDYRILTSASSTKIGLPEIKLGVLPGFGGTQRLPRLVGLPAALDMILKGKLLSAKQARRVGLADKVVGGESKAIYGETLYAHLEQVASEVALSRRTISKKKLSLKEYLLTYSGIGRALVHKNAKAAVLKNTKGHYPAPPRALDITLLGLKKGMEAGLGEEAKALGELVVTPECKSLVHLYFLTDDSTKRWRSVQHTAEEEKIAVVGGGIMGAGIAVSFLMSKFPVVIVDPADASRKRARRHIEGVLEKRRSISAKQAKDALERLQITEELSQIARSSVVIEAIIEDLEVKRVLFDQMRQFIDDTTVIASNTSSLPISEFTSELNNPGRLIGMHFFNPAEKMPLVEVVCTKTTDDRTIAFTAGLAVTLGKYPIVVQEVPGFLINRTLSPYLAEAGQLLSEGYSVRDIDTAALKFGMPMGPLRLLDEVGLDVAGHVALIMEKSYGSRMASPQFSRKLVAAGRLGRKSGAGFYRYEGKEAYDDRDVVTLLGLEPKKNDSARSFQIADRLILSMLNEAVRCLDDGVAGSPGAEAAGQVDLGTVMGLGFAPFRGGVFHYAESIGAHEIAERLRGLEKSHGERFSPAPGILSRAEKNQSFYEAVSLH